MFLLCTTSLNSGHVGTSQTQVVSSASDLAQLASVQAVLCQLPADYVSLSSTYSQLSPWRIISILIHHLLDGVCGTSGPDDGPTEVERTGVRDSVSFVLDVGVVFWGP